MIQIELIYAIAGINFIAGFIGVILIYLNKNWDEDKLHRGLGFSAGILIAIAILEIIPTAIEMSGSNDIMIYTLLGFLIFFLLEQFILIHHFDRHSEHGSKHYQFTSATFIALCIHAFLDGIVIGIGFEFSEEFGIIVFVAIIFHRFPLAISMANIFLFNNVKNTAMLKMTIFSSMAPFGLIFAISFLSSVPIEVLASLIAVSGGMFIYLGATDMIPELSHNEIKEVEGLSQLIKLWLKWESTIFVVLGMFVALIPHFLLK